MTSKELDQLVRAAAEIRHTAEVIRLALDSDRPEQAFAVITGACDWIDTQSDLVHEIAQAGYADVEGDDDDPPIRSVAERLTDLIGYPPTSITGEGPR